MSHHYKRMEKIGEGMFGSVFRARRRLTAQIVALKYIPKFDKKGKERAGLRREIEILKGLKHDNIVLLLDTFETEEHFCLVLEYARGELFEILRQEYRFPEALVQNVARQLVHALDYLHERHIIHRDMKPQNVLISAKGTVKLCDFGFARSGLDRAALMKSIKGTPLYMAPELIRNLPYDCCVDLWSLGVILYELLYGEPPFVADGFPHLMKVIKTHTVSFEKQTISDGMRDFLQGLLVKDPANRLKWPELRQHPVVAADAQPIRSDLSRLYNLGWNDWEAGAATPAVHALDDASETKQLADAPRSKTSGVQPDNERNEPPRALVSPVPDPQIVATLPTKRAGWCTENYQQQPEPGSTDVVDGTNSIHRVERDDARRERTKTETVESAKNSTLQPVTHDSAATTDILHKSDAWTAASQSKDAPDVSSARTAFAQTRSSPSASDNPGFTSSKGGDDVEAAAAESSAVLSATEADRHVAAGTDLFNAKIVSDFAPTATQLRWERVNDAEEFTNADHSAEFITTNPLREYIIEQSSETKLEKHSTLPWRTQSGSQYEGPPYLHKQFWMALVKAAKTVPLGQQLFDVVVAPCAGACYAMLAANWRMFARGHSRLEPEALVYNLNAASLVVQAISLRSAPSDHPDPSVLDSGSNGATKSPSENNASSTAERNMLIGLRTVGIAALRCVLFYAHNHSRRNREGGEAGMSSNGTDAADVDGRRLLPCIDAMLKLLCHIVAAAGVFLMPAVNGRAPVCWVMGYLVGLPQVLQLYEYHRPLSESFAPTAAGGVPTAAARGSEHFFALIRSIFTSIDMFSFSSTGVYIQLHRQGTMTFLTACLRRSAKALKHCLAAAESAGILDEHTKLDGSESGAGLNDTQAQAAPLAFAGVQAALVSEIKSQTLVLFELLRPALRSWDVLARQRGILTPIVDQELELQQYVCLPIEHVSQEHDPANPRARGMFSADILAKKTQIHFRTVKGLVDQLCGAIAAPPSSRRQLDATVSERPCLLVVCRALHAMLRNAETQLATTLSARVLPLSPSGLGELVELLASVDATLGLVLCCAEHSVQCARILMQSTTLLSIVSALSGFCANADDTAHNTADSTPWDVRVPVKVFGDLLSARLRSHFRLAEMRSERKADIGESKSSLSTLKRRQKPPGVGSSAAAAGSRLAAARNALGVKRAVSLLEKVRAKGPQLIACLLRAGFDELANAPQVLRVDELQPKGEGRPGPCSEAVSRLVTVGIHALAQCFSTSKGGTTLPTQTNEDSSSTGGTNEIGGSRVADLERTAAGAGLLAEILMHVANLELLKPAIEETSLATLEAIATSHATVATVCHALQNHFHVARNNSNGKHSGGHEEERGSSSSSDAPALLGPTPVLRLQAGELLRQSVYVKFGVSQGSTQLDALLSGLETVLSGLDQQASLPLGAPSQNLGRDSLRFSGSSAALKNDFSGDDNSTTSNDATGALLFGVWCSLLRPMRRSMLASALGTKSSEVEVLALPRGLGPLSVLSYLRLVASLVGRFGHLQFREGAFAAGVHSTAAKSSDLGSSASVNDVVNAGVREVHEPSVFAVLRTVCLLLSDTHVKALLSQSNAWRLGGGLSGAALLLRYCALIVREAFVSSCDDAQFGDIQRLLFEGALVSQLVNGINLVATASQAEFHDEATTSNSAGISGDLADVVMVLSRLVVASTHHTSQFMAANGPAVLLKAGFLDFKPGSMDQSLFDTLAIFVHVARNSDANVRALLCQDTGGHFDTDQGTTPNSPLMEILNCLLIHHPSVAIHELVCKLLGNMFRHSDQCHEAALRSPESPAILGSLVHQLEVHGPSQDILVRNACVAVGNAAFHGGPRITQELYRQGVVSHLVRVLKPDARALFSHHAKTRANAAAALGNLARKSDHLCPVLVGGVSSHHQSQQSSGKQVELSAVDTLLHAVIHDPDSAVRCVALFSVGTIFSHDLAKRTARSPGAQELLDMLRYEQPTEHQTDKFETYRQRLLLKLND